MNAIGAQINLNFLDLPLLERVEVRKSGTNFFMTRCILASVSFDSVLSSGP